jgi:hypothetical protein
METKVAWETVNLRQFLPHQHSLMSFQSRINCDLPCDNVPDSLRQRSLCAHSRFLRRLREPSRIRPQHRLLFHEGEVHRVSGQA